MGLLSKRNIIRNPSDYLDLILFFFFFFFFFFEVRQFYCLSPGVCMLDKEHHSTLPVTIKDHEEVLLVGLQVILQDIIGSALASPVTDHSCGALDDLPGLALLVDLAEPSPLAQLHVGVHLDQGDSMLLTEGSDQLLVHGLVAVLGEDAEQGLPLVQSLGSLPQTSGETVGNQSLLEHLLDCLIDAHWAGGLNGGSARHISFNIGHVAILDCANVLQSKYS